MCVDGGWGVSALVASHGRVDAFVVHQVKAALATRGWVVRSTAECCVKCVVSGGRRSEISLALAVDVGVLVRSRAAVATAVSARSAGGPIWVRARTHKMHTESQHEKPDMLDVSLHGGPENQRRVLACSAPSMDV